MMVWMMRDEGEVSKNNDQVWVWHGTVDDGEISNEGELR